MSKRNLYIIIAILVSLLLYVFFMPVAVTQAPVVLESERSNEAEPVAETEQTIKPALDETSDTNPDAEEVRIEGTFVGLLDGEDAYQKKFKYLLLNDGLEVLRIDLRAMVGYSATDVEGQLGIERNDTITVVGTMQDGEFVAATIQ